MTASNFWRLTRRVRAADRKDFREALGAINTSRTRAVGWVLFAFSVFWTTLALLGMPDATLFPFVLFLISLAIGLGMIHLGSDRLRHGGEWVVLAVAVAWMFYAVDSQITEGFGLVEFVIGTLALAMLRPMTPIQAAAALTFFAITYTIILWSNGLLALYPVNNGVLFCLFAFILSVGNFNSTVLLFRNRRMVDQLNHQNRQLTTWAMHDPLTGLANRRYFDQLLARHWSDDTLSQQPIALILMDIDDFKGFNDRNGHPEGDQCLREIAELLNGLLRPQATCVRLGGEEFAILLPDTTLKDAQAVANRTREAIERQGQVTASFGVGSVVPAQQSSDDFYVACDQALYTAKRRGRNRVAVV